MGVISVIFEKIRLQKKKKQTTKQNKTKNRGKYNPSKSKVDTDNNEWTTSGLYRGRVPRLTPGNLYVLRHRDRIESGETMSFVSAGHIIATPIQLVGSEVAKARVEPGSS